MTIATTKSTAWALRLPGAAAGALGALRLCEDVEVGQGEGGELWLRGRRAEEPLAAALRGLPATVRFAWRPDGRLQRHGEVLATERLPTVEWRRLQDWLAFALPPAQLPAEMPAPVSLALHPGHDARPANAALLPLAAWLDWMETAPALRLAPLRFAATTGGQCLVLGRPLPALPGRPCCEEAGVIVPAGLEWRPAVSAAVIRRVLNVPAGSLIVWDERGVQTLETELLVPAGRGAVRATRAVLKLPAP